MTRTSSVTDPAANPTAQAEYPDHSLVRIRCDVRAGLRSVRSGSIGTVVSRYGKSGFYLVEFADGSDTPITLSINENYLAHA